MCRLPVGSLRKLDQKTIPYTIIAGVVTVPVVVIIQNYGKMFLFLVLFFRASLHIPSKENFV